MLRVTVEIMPHGNPHKRRSLGTVDIVNVGGDEEIGNYEVTYPDGHTHTVRGHVRRNGGWALIAKALAPYGKWMR